ncbi:MAG: nucleotidyltransferase domain-containing protein [Thiobacillaceae bacterium]|nr:nucleotidyltransferase domain-containing protein [Thiobacillaceae bacterium]MCX7672470.1 nucleotidyltransferase domain-containing protein [Thiobacillaceae bacterium]MDW8323098.1 nucleotidyltransferase domain-containing protein [Burkholderiales bacterium]
MLSEAQLKDIARTLGEAARPAKVILFGSYARGEADEGSDADFLVIESQVSDPVREMVRLNKLLAPLGVPVDILVCSEREVQKRRDWSSTALYWALREGRLLYESHL